MHTNKKKTDFNPGDIVLFHKRKWIVLEKVEFAEDRPPVYHIFCPNYRVYSALDYEMKYVDHLFEFETLVGKFEELELNKTA